MIYLILSIISTTSLFVIFRVLSFYRIHTFNTIIINYLIAALFGLAVTSGNGIRHSEEWLYISFIIGIFFIIMFYVIGLSTQKTGIAVTTIASKMSVVIPMFFSIFYDPGDTLTNLKLAGIITTLVAVFLIVYRKRTIDFDPRFVFLPVILFFGLGFVDSMVKYAQFKYITDAHITLFATYIFIVSFIAGIMVKLFSKSTIKSVFSKKTLLMGSLLGICNYGSIYFIVKSLNYRKGAIDGSVVFGVNNLGVVSLSVILGLFIFKEKLTPINWVGVAMSIIAIVLLAYS